MSNIERLIMYEGKQIILDGEVYGDNVIVNRQFELIYEISPLIIKNFINIINETVLLSKPVRIKKYGFIENNCICISFKTKFSSGEMQLAYVLNKQEELLLDTYNLRITDGENQGYFIAKQNIAKSGKINHKQYNISQEEEVFVDINNNEQKAPEATTTHAEQIDTETTESLEQILEKAMNIDTEESLQEDTESNNTHEEANIPLTEANENNELMYSEKVPIFDQTASEADMAEIKKSIYNNNVNRKNKTYADEPSAQADIEETEETVEKEVSISALQETTIVDTTAEETHFFQDSSLEKDSGEQEELDSNSDETAQIENTELFNSINNITSINNINITDNVNSLNGVELGVNTELEITDELKAEKEEISSEASVDIATVEECENAEYHTENPETNNSNFQSSNNYDLVDFFDLIPNFSDLYLEENETTAIEHEEELTQSLNKEITENKKIRKSYKLNRKEKIALYQNILNGYDNKMIENKLNNFKENFNLIQKENNITIEDVLDAQVDLLIDNESKAFRILGDDIKQDVIQIDDELFLSKDKIYTWGEAYLLDYSQDKA